MGMRGMAYPGPSRKWELAALMQFPWPPTVRLGLLEVLQLVGGEEAEKVLVEVLETTQRPLEVAFLAWAMEERWPGKHREALIRVARDLLQHPPVPVPDDPQYAAGPGLLYPVLDFFCRQRVCHQRGSIGGSVQWAGGHLGGGVCGTAPGGGGGDPAGEGVSGSPVGAGEGPDGSIGEGAAVGWGICGGGGVISAGIERTSRGPGGGHAGALGSLI
jgi:hypothetical protein